MQCLCTSIHSPIINWLPQLSNDNGILVEYCILQFGSEKICQNVSLFQTCCCKQEDEANELKLHANDLQCFLII